MNSGNKNSSSKSGGIGFVGLLAIAFIVLKLCKIITWSWLWVLSPLWMGIAIVIVILVGYIVWNLISDGISRIKKKVKIKKKKEKN